MMRKIPSICLALLLSCSAFAQQPDSATFLQPDSTFASQSDSAQTLVDDSVPLVIQTAPVPPANENIAPPAKEKTPGVIGGVNLWFLAILCMIVAGFIGWGLRVRYEKTSRKKVPENNPLNTAAMPTEYHPVQPTSETVVPAERPVMADTMVVPEPTQMAAPLPLPAEKPLVEQLVAEAPQPEVFYMTVPGTDGSFAAGAKKTSPAGCLYKFVVAPAMPQVAEISFAGNETDMRNAQAFRDLELLPACAFSGMPDSNTFRFTQTPGRAVFDGNAWQVKEKIVIAFG